MKANYWFPTTVYSEVLPNATELNKYLLKQIKQWKQKDKKGIEKTNRNGWHSQTDMHKRKEYEPLVKEILRAHHEVCRQEYYTHPTIIGNMWTNINYPGSSNVAHIHSNSHWSGVYYIKTPKNSGTLALEDPRGESNMFAPRQKQDLPTRLWRLIHYKPEEGRLLFFPSYILHAVTENLSKLKGTKGWRISVSFNLIQETLGNK